MLASQTLHHHQCNVRKDTITLSVHALDPSDPPLMNLPLKVTQLVTILSPSPAPQANCLFHHAITTPSTPFHHEKRGPPLCAELLRRATTDSTSDSHHTDAVRSVDPSTSDPSTR